MHVRHPGSFLQIAQGKGRQSVFIQKQNKHKAHLKAHSPKDTTIIPTDYRHTIGYSKLICDNHSLSLNRYPLPFWNYYYYSVCCRVIQIMNSLNYHYSYSLPLCKRYIIKLVGAKNTNGDQTHMLPLIFMTVLSLSQGAPYILALACGES